MDLSPLRGAVAFLTRLPVDSDERDWRAMRANLWTLPVVGYLVGLLAALVLVPDLPAPTAAVAYVAVLFLVTGINHADGLADLGDAAVVHGDPARRRSVMKDTTVGVGGIVALGVGLAGLVAGGFLLAALPTLPGVALAVASEVGAKLGMVTLSVRGRPSHDGMGAQLLGASDRAEWLGLGIALPVALVALPATAAAVVVGPLVALATMRWADDALGGVGGDVFGATNELARVVAVHAGVVAWTLF
ncbi:MULTISPECIES: adenosylcobinamide-GDP ribazoletransferase [Salinibaculum]|uniref:adenosylcobinamide-GDP ribazoletransferase n=1 Tax=Salinibaculum TaxID=2732368 RepID=UPI0030CC5935